MAAAAGADFGQAKHFCMPWATAVNYQGDAR